MEDITTSFFINSLKVHIESSINKFKGSQDLIFHNNFDNIFLNPIFINNIKLFRGIIIKNNLNFKTFWSHIGKYMKLTLVSLISKFQEDINDKNIVNDNNEINLIKIGEINLLKLNILIVGLNLIIFSDEKENENKDEIKRLLENYIEKEISNKKDFSLFIKNYLITISLLINNNKEINLSFLRYLSILFYNFETVFKESEIIKHLNIYIKQSINNPKYALNIYLNGAFDIKCYKNEKMNRSRSESIDNKEININNNTEKKNKKINDYFKKEAKKGKENTNNENITEEKNNFFKNSNCLKEKKLNSILSKNNEIINNEEDKENLKYLVSNESNKSLFNYGSNISKHSNSIFLSEGFSFFKYNNNENNNNLNIDETLNISKLFSKPLSELDNKESKENKRIAFRFPPFVKCFKTKKRKPLDKLKNFLFNSQMNIRKYIKVGNKNRENESINELRNIINLNFYGNEINDNNENLNNINENDQKENIVINTEDQENNQDEVLMAKTPIKENFKNPENKEINFKENINKIKKSWQILFSQNANFNP